MSGDVLLARDGGIVTVTLSAPERRNALNVFMWRRLGEILAELESDGTVRCVVLRGAGDEAFAAGADISEFETERSTAELARAYALKTHGTLRTLAALRHPVIAMIGGVCVGGGLELAACCDLRISGESGRFGIPVKRLGLVVAIDEMQPLIEIVGKAAALEILLEGRVFGAEEALGKRLVNRVVPDYDLEPATYASARRIAEGAPLTARWHKQFVNRLMDPAPLTEAERDESYDCFATEDFQIGYHAFLAKKNPEFEGR